MKQKIYVTEPSMPSYEEYCNEIRSIWENKHITNFGPKHDVLEANLATYLGADNLLLYTNGHLALEAALRVLDLNGEVITTPFTFASTTQAIVNCGLTPIFCDIEPEHFTIDTYKLEKLITKNTTAIVAVHVYGYICDYKRLAEIAKTYNLKLIYDAAHTFGCKVDGTDVGSLGDVSMFSLHATKVFNTIEGGALVFSNSGLLTGLSAYRDFGIFGKEDIENIGINAKMNEFQAAMGICNLRRVDDDIKKRKMVSDRYRQQLKDVRGIYIPPEQPDVKSNYSYFAVCFNKDKSGKSRDEVNDALMKHDIYARKYFYPLTSEYSVYNGKFTKQETPVAKTVANNVLTLPLHHNLGLENVDRICEIIMDSVRTYT